MSIATRAATCSSCSKRLTRKQWYYRNGAYYCTRRCWVTEREKAAQEAAKPEPATGASDRVAHPS